MMEEDAVVGVTSNPTIFQKAISQGDAYDEQLKELLEREQTIRRRSSSTSPCATSSPRSTCSRRCTSGTRRTATSRSRSTRTSPTTRRRRSTRRSGCTSWIDRPNLYVKIPGDEAGPAGDRGLHRGRPQHQRHADLLARDAQRVDGGVPPRARAVRRGRRRPDEGALGRELLRLARRHRDRQAARGDRLRRGARAPRQARDRERAHRVRALREGVPGRALGVARGEGRAAAALPVGLHLDEEPGVPRRPLRRGADRPAHGEHDAGGDDRGLPGSRRGARRHGARRRRRGAQAARAARRGRRRLRRRRATLEKEGVQKFSDSFTELLDGVRAKREAVAA